MPAPMFNNLSQVTKLYAKVINPFEKCSGKVKLFCKVSHTSYVNETANKISKVIDKTSRAIIS